MPTGRATTGRWLRSSISAPAHQGSSLCNLGQVISTLQVSSVSWESHRLGVKSQWNNLCRALGLVPGGACTPGTAVCHYCFFYCCCCGSKALSSRFLPSCRGVTQQTDVHLWWRRGQEHSRDGHSPHQACQGGLPGESNALAEC